MRRLLAAGALVGGGALATAAVVFACTAQTAISLDARSARAGVSVSGTGYGFYNPSTDPVQVRFSSDSGPLLWQGPPTGNNIAFSFVVPNSQAGYYTIVAIQRPAATEPANTPFRASTVLQIIGSSQPAPALTNDAAVGGPPPSGSGIAAVSGGGSSGVVALPAQGSSIPAGSSGQAPAAIGRAPHGNPLQNGLRSGAEQGRGPLSPLNGSQPNTVPPGASLATGATDAPALAPVPWPRQAAIDTVPAGAGAGTPSGPSPWLGLATVGGGLLITLGAAGSLVGQRQRSGAPAKLIL